MLRALATVSPLHARPLRPSEGKRRFPLISAGISLFIIHCSLLIINYHEEVCLEYHSQSDHRRSHRHRRGLRPASLPIVLASLPHPFPLPKEDNLPKRGHPLPEGQSFSRGRPLLKEPGTALHPAGVKRGGRSERQERPCLSEASWDATASEGRRVARPRQP